MKKDLEELLKKAMHGKYDQRIQTDTILTDTDNTEVEIAQRSRLKRQCANCTYLLSKKDKLVKNACKNCLLRNVFRCYKCLFKRMHIFKIGEEFKKKTLNI